MGYQEFDNLKMAKKRDHKIMITEEAIKRVPYIEYREIPNEEYKIIHELVCQVLKLSKEENNSNEVAITYSFDTDKVMKQEDVIGVQFGDEHSVNSSGLKGYQDATKYFISNCHRVGIIYEDR